MSTAQDIASETRFYARLAEVALKENPTTGYTWSLGLPRQLTLVKDAYVPDFPILAGSGGTHIFTLRSSEAGAFELTATLSRAGGEPEEKRIITVVFP
ncbi:protease inhibitor I42 family protein [Nocardia sp. NBC_01377]|uniref:protease inhibitor I42 family protein n=1 Tax=Nocardia sp. NBC_01377 TaxID=2903595 RepID=UPI00324D1296